MSLIEAHSRRRPRSASDGAETNLPGALTQGKLEPWSATSHQIIQSLIRGLSFSEMHDRQESIHDNFEGTFKWIYHPPRDVDRPWDSFTTWLTMGHGIYWITGKAGSGKSTLMRMLHQNERTVDLLRIWCSNLPLVTASFFFWNSGSKIQMSQDGLLRSVLLQIHHAAAPTRELRHSQGKTGCFRHDARISSDFSVQGSNAAVPLRY